MTLMPTPADDAEERDSTSPSYARTSVSDARETYTSSSSPWRAAEATSVASSTRSETPAAGPAARATRSGTGGPPYRHRAHPQRGLAAADGHALAVLAARARHDCEVPRHGVDAAQHLGPVADQVGVAQRLGDAAVL